MPLYPGSARLPDKYNAGLPLIDVYWWLAMKPKPLPNSGTHALPHPILTVSPTSRFILYIEWSLLTVVVTLAAQTFARGEPLAVFKDLFLRYCMRLIWDRQNRDLQEDQKS